MREQDGHGGDGAGDHGENWAVVPRSPPPPPAHPDELRRQVAKDKIRERILREEAEHWALEAEVRRELMEQLFPFLRSGLRRSSGARTEGSDAMAAPAGMMTADSPSPIVLEVCCSSFVYFVFYLLITPFRWKNFSYATEN